MLLFFVACPAEQHSSPTHEKKHQNFKIGHLLSCCSIRAAACADALSAQTPTREQGTAPPVTIPLPQQNQGLTATDDVAPVYGLQGVLIETLDGKIVSSQSADQPFNPASSVKLATALVALRNFGPNHRFTTGFWTDGSLDKATGQVMGNLYVTGRDPSFHHEHAVMIARQLNSLGIRSVTGNLIVAPGFTMNFNSSARGSGDSPIRHSRRHATIQ